MSNRNGISSNDYVGFDQFMLEQNFLTNPQLRSNASVPYYVQSNFAINPAYTQLSNQMPQLTEMKTEDIVRNSNLLPTASEFVPQTVPANNFNDPTVPSMSSLQLSAAGDGEAKQGAIKKTSSNRYPKNKENNQGGRGLRRNERNREWNQRVENRTAGSGRTASQYQHDDRGAYGRQNYQNYPKTNFDRGMYRNNEVDNRRSHHYDRSRSNYYTENYNEKKSHQNSHQNSHGFDGKGSSSSAKGAEKVVNIPKPETDNKCSQREKLVREIDAGKLECLICCENIKTWNQTWNCSNCFHIIHLSCVVKWANSSASSGSWRCPACQNISESIPKHYFCFCKKLQNPEYNRSDIAHSCGELCERTDGCEHSCKLLCHPGQ